MEGIYRKRNCVSRKFSEKFSGRELALTRPAGFIDRQAG
jgi:hypothetical protein